MNERTRERVSEWDSQPFSDGYEGLHALADERFTGAVVAGETHLFMLNGRVVGVHDGTIETFEDASGTVYDAPHKSLPLLFSMLESDGERQGTYYTNDTPLSETDEMLRDASFTGYVELSENVLSGDYYTVYYGGRSMSAAFVGTSEELLTGDEAFERADDEVGLYEVVKVDVDIVDIPEPAGTESETAESAAAASTAAAAASVADATDEAESTDAADSETVAEAAGDVAESTAASEPSESAASTSTETAAAAAEPSEAATSDSATESPAETSTTAGDTADEPATAAEAEVAENADADAASEAASTEAAIEEAEPQSTLETASVLEEAEPMSEGEADDAGRPGPAEPGEAPVAEGPTARAVRDDSADSEPAPERQAPQRSRAKPGETASQGVDERFEEEAQWRSTKSVPAIDPEKSATAKARRDERAAAERRRREQKHAQRTQRSQRAQSSAQESQRGGRSERERDLIERARNRIGTLERAVEERDERIDALERELENAGDAERVAELERELANAEERAAEAAAGSEELESVRSELESVREERDALRERVEELETQLAEAGGGVADGEALDAETALAGTNLFVRYGSKAEATLDAVGETAPEDINANLTLEHHTQFEADDATVDGEPFDAFLESTPEYRFVSWVVRELPYEILDTGHRKGLADVFDVVPEIDRAELRGAVTVEDEEGGEHVEEFDVVVRDRMGNPLLVADLNTSRDPVRGEEMEALVSSAGTVATHAELGGAFYVTSSFFEPDALEAASTATDAGGLLSRSEKESYVKVARKNGFHLCLVEDRNGTFHLTVPEL